MQKINYKILFLLTAITIGFTNCTKKLDEKIYREDINGNFYQKSDEVMAAFVLTYAFMQTHIYQVHFQVTEFSTDEACVPVLYGEYVDQGGQWLRLHQHTWTAADPWL